MTSTRRAATALPATMPAAALRVGTLLLTGALALVPFMGHAQSAPATAGSAAADQTAAPDVNPATSADATAPATKPATAGAAAPAGKPAGQPAATRSATAGVQNAQGSTVGQVTIADTASGALHITVDLSELPPGSHAIHIHETGICEPPDFTSAGGHLAAGKAHGAKDPGGMHPGDLPNVTVAGDGTLKAEFFSPDLTMAQVMDDDGSAFVMHGGSDDYASQPSGDAGARIACGVFKATPE